jgi:hypothetical protein
MIAEKGGKRGTTQTGTTFGILIDL